MFSCIKCVQVFSASPYATPVSESVNAVIVIISFFILFKVGNCLPVLISIIAVRGADNPKVIKVGRL